MMDDAFKIAADAAKQEIITLKGRRDALHKQIAEINARMQKLRVIIHIHNPNDEQAIAEYRHEKLNTHPRGMLFTEIKEVLQATSRNLTNSEIQRRVEQRTGFKFSRSNTHRVLKDGAHKGVFQKTGKTWQLRDEKK